MLFILRRFVVLSGCRYYFVGLTLCGCLLPLVTVV